MLEQKSDKEQTWPIHHWGIGSDMFVWCPSTPCLCDVHNSRMRVSSSQEFKGQGRS